MFSNAALISTLLCCILAQVSPAQARDARPTVAVANIEIAQGGWTLPPPQLSATIAELVVDHLVSSERFHVVDGEWLVPESQSGGRASLEMLRAAAGQDHVDYLVLGAVTQFATEQHARRGGGLLPLPFVGGGLSRRESTTTVGLTLRLVDVRTGEIVRSISAQGVGRRKANALGLLAAVHGVPLGVAAAGSFSGSRDGMLDDAVREAVRITSNGLAGALSAIVSKPLDLR